MMRQNGVVLKPIVKKDLGEREVSLYKELNNTSDKSMTELRSFVPQFHGIKKVAVDGKEIECIVLEDLTAHFKNPCVMDIKIGRRTWGPNASYEKMMTEDVSHFYQ